MAVTYNHALRDRHQEIEPNMAQVDQTIAINQLESDQQSTLNNEGEITGEQVNLNQTIASDHSTFFESSNGEVTGIEENHDNENEITDEQVNQTIASDQSTFFESSIGEVSSVEGNHDNIKEITCEQVNQTTTSDQSTFFESLNGEENGNAFQIGNISLNESDIVQNDSSEINEEGTVEVEEAALNVSKDVKCPLENVVLDAADNDAFNEMFNVSIDNGDGEQVTISPGGTKKYKPQHIVSPGGTRKIKHRIDDECVITYKFGEEIKPMELGYQVKLNDPLSNNMPFKENVRFFNYFKTYSVLQHTYIL